MSSAFPDEASIRAAPLAGDARKPLPDARNDGLDIPRRHTGKQADGGDARRAGSGRIARPVHGDATDREDRQPDRLAGAAEPAGPRHVMFRRLAPRREHGAKHQVVRPAAPLDGRRFLRIMNRPADEKPFGNEVAYAIGREA
jgi:hypothetical protein